MQKNTLAVTLANIQQKCAYILQKDIKPIRTTCCLTMYCICRDLSVFHQRSLHLRVQLKLNFGGGDNETVHLGNKRLAGAISWREVCCEIAKNFFSALSLFQRWQLTMICSLSSEFKDKGCSIITKYKRQCAGLYLPWLLSDSWKDRQNWNLNLCRAAFAIIAMILCHFFLSYIFS